MSKYFVTPEPTNQYPFTLQDLRVRPAKKRSGLVAVGAAAVVTVLCGAAAAYAFMVSVSDPVPAKLASPVIPVEIEAVAGEQAVEENVQKPTAVEAAAVEAVPGKALAVEPKKVKTFPVTADISGAPLPLKKDDPRWVDGATISSAKPLEQRKDSEAVLAALNKVAFAETEEEVVALEEQMNPDLIPSIIDEAAIDEPADDEEIRPARITAPSFATGDLVTAQAAKWVNMRASDNKHAAKIMVVPQGANIKADPACTHWCRAVYDGRQGYIYRSYVSFSGETKVAGSAPAKSAGKAPGTGILKKLVRGGSPASRQVDP